MLDRQFPQFQVWVAFLVNWAAAHKFISLLVQFDTVYLFHVYKTFYWHKKQLDLIIRIKCYNTTVAASSSVAGTAGQVTAILISHLGI
jgi:hypothetical protein